MFCRNCGKDVVDSAEFCPQCGARPLAGNGFCNACGAQSSALSEMCTKCGTRLKGAAVQAAVPGYAPAMAVGGLSQKTRLIAALLCFFLGTFGAHRFYAGKVGSAVGQLLISVFAYIFQAIGIAVGAFAVIGTIMISAVGVWVFIDFIFILIGKFKDKNGLLIGVWTK